MNIVTVSLGLYPPSRNDCVAFVIGSLYVLEADILKSGIQYACTMEAVRPKVCGVMHPRQRTVDRYANCQSCTGNMNQTLGHTTMYHGVLDTI